MKNDIQLDSAGLTKARKDLHKLISGLDEVPATLRAQLFISVDNIDYYAQKYELGMNISRTYHSEPGVDPEANNETEVQDNVETIKHNLIQEKPEYKNEIFQIYSDYQACKNINSPRVCAGLFIIALARALIPFASIGD